MLVKEKWRWLNTRAIGFGIQIRPVHWLLRLEHGKSGMAWHLMAAIGPLAIEISFWAADDRGL